MPTKNLNHDSDDKLVKTPNYDLSGKSKFQLSLIASQYEQLFEGLYDLVGRIEHLDNVYGTKKEINRNTRLVSVIKQKIFRLEKIIAALAVFAIFQTVILILLYFK